MLGGILWFLPVALCAAEMSTVEGWQNGGIFSWVSQTLGERFGFAAIFFQWFQITVGFVTMIYFILGALSYVLNFQALNTDPLLKYIGLLVIFWGLTFSQLGGTQTNGKNCEKQDLWSVSLFRPSFYLGWQRLTSLEEILSKLLLVKKHSSQIFHSYQL